MILGNTFGKNKGKKYLVRSKIDAATDALYADRAEQFNEWFGQHYNEIVRFLRSKQMYNEDAVNETYLRMYECILYAGLEIEDYKSYFMRSFYTNFVNSSMHNNRYSTLTPNYDRSDAEDGSFAEMIMEQQRFEENILNYIYARYDIREFELFKMYISLKPAVNYYSLAEITGIKVHNIQRTISRIKKDVQKNKSLIEKGIFMETKQPITEKAKPITDGYSLCKDYDLLWQLRNESPYPVICVVDYHAGKTTMRGVAELTPNGEIFTRGECYSDFENCTKEAFVRQCERLNVEFLKPDMAA